MSQFGKHATKGLVTALGIGLSVTCLMSACSSAPQQGKADDSEPKVSEVTDSPDKDASSLGSSDESPLSDEEPSSPTRESSLGLPVVMDNDEVGTKGIIMGRFSVDEKTKLVMVSDLSKGKMGAQLKEVGTSDPVWEHDAEGDEEVEFSVEAGDYYVIAIGYDGSADGTVTIDFAK